MAKLSIINFSNELNLSVFSYYTKMIYNFCINGLRGMTVFYVLRKILTVDKILILAYSCLLFLSLDVINSWIRTYTPLENDKIADKFTCISLNYIC